MKTASADWEAIVLPLNYARNALKLLQVRTIQNGLATSWVLSRRKALLSRHLRITSTAAPEQIHPRSRSFEGRDASERDRKVFRGLDHR